jgi:hypothetical protein
MKVLYHVLAATVGLAAAGIIVFLVFGAASEQGASQDGRAPRGAGGTTVCGKLPPAATRTPAAQAAAAAALPAMFDPSGPIPGFEVPEQEAWFARVHAAAGMCTDEIGFVETGVARLSMSVVPPVTQAQASQYAAGAIAAAFSAPFNPRSVSIEVVSDAGIQRAAVSLRAWQAFTIARRQLGVPLTMESLAQFKQARYRPSDLTVTGWSAAAG